MIKQLLNDLFGPSIEEFKNINKELKLLKRMRKVTKARSIILKEADYYLKENNVLASRTFLETDNQIEFAYKYLKNDLKELRRR